MKNPGTITGGTCEPDGIGGYISENKHAHMSQDWTASAGTYISGSNHTRTLYVIHASASMATKAIMVRHPYKTLKLGVLTALGNAGAFNTAWAANTDRRRYYSRQRPVGPNTEAHRNFLF